jgi:O-antigen/teichoic acid export membrane protein
MKIDIKFIMKTSFKSEFVKELVLFSGFGLLVGTYGIFSEFTCRSIVVENLGVDKIGLYSPVIVWAGLFTGFILPSFSTYLYPRFAETKSNNEIIGVLNDAFRLGSFALIPLLFLAIPYRDFFIPLLYSKEFSEASLYLPTHFIGVVFYVYWFVFTQAMSPTGRIKQHGFLMILFLTLDIIVTYITVPIFGLYGWMLKHIISPFIFFHLYYFYMKKSIDFKFSWSNIAVMSYLVLGSVLLLLINLWLGDNNLIRVLGPLFVLFSWFFLKLNEKAFVKARVIMITDRMLRKH